MKRKIKFIQENCIEGGKIDLRQANVVSKHKPDIVMFELPQGKVNPDTVFNKYPTNKKPLKEVDVIIKGLRQVAKKYPYAKSDIAVWNNIKKLWKNKKNVYVYNIDGPSELRKYFMNFEYPKCRKDFMFWVYLFLREYLYMKKNVEWVLNKNPKGDLKIAIFLQSIHWNHTKFLLTNPSKEKIWEYYFGEFKDITPENIDGKIKEKNKIIYKYWKKVSIFK
jgi:hypothetical protein